MGNDDLPFIVSCGPKLQEDSGVRSLIRQKAMRNVAQTRKKRSNKTRTNLGPTWADLELPLQTSKRVAANGADSTSSDSDGQTGAISESSTDTDVNDSTDSSVSTKSIVQSSNKRVQRRAAAKQVPSYSISVTLLSGYEAARAKFEVDVTDLSMLTNFSVSSATVTALSSNPDRLKTLLGHSVWSYLQFVPSHYGPSPYLTAATDCLLAKYQGVLLPHKRNVELETRLYTRTLRFLQEALTDPSTCMRSDVLCATQLIGLHEILSPADEEAYIHHVRGTATLVRHRTAHRFQTDFDKALFAAHIGPVVFGSLMNNKHCYLEEPQWLELYRSMAQKSNCLDDRCSLAIGIRSQMIILPGLWHDVHEAIIGPELFNDETLALLGSRCDASNRGICDWMEEYKAHCLATSLTLPTSQELDKRRELLGIGFECLAVVKRLSATVYDADRLLFEAEAQQMVRAIWNLQKQVSGNHSWLFMRHESNVADAIMATKEQWETQIMYDSERERKLARRRRYLTWSNMLRSSH